MSPVALTRVISRVPLVLWLIVSAAGCSTFSTVRSASVRPDYSFSGQVSASTRPGPDVTWFYTFLECYECDYPLYGAELALTHGWSGSGRTPPRSVGVGTNGFFPYVDAYVQLREASPTRNPLGLGGRFGFPLMGWRQHQLYARYDVPLGPNKTLLLNPALFVHHGGERHTRGLLLAFVQGVGVEIEGPNASITPSVSAVLSRAQRPSGFSQHGSQATRLFATASVGFSFYRRERP